MERKSGPMFVPHDAATLTGPYWEVHGRAEYEEGEGPDSPTHE